MGVRHGNSLPVIILYHRIRLPTTSTATIAAIIAGIFSGAGFLFFVKALEQGKASIIISLTAVYSVITAITASIMLRVRISICQGIDILLAIAASISLSMK